MTSSSATIEQKLLEPMPKIARRARTRGGMRLQERRKVLIVEDDLGLAMALGIRMRYEGFQVVCAKNKAQGMNLAIEERPDAIVLDLGLPDGNGFEIMRVVRNIATTVGIPIFVVSGWNESTNESRAQEFEIERYFVKPVDTGALIAAIHDTLDSTS